MEPGGRLDYWRKYFRSANSDIINVIENAILVAASDCPNEFYKHRCRIAEKLFSCRVSRCSGCNHIELRVPAVEQEEEEEEEDGELKEERDDTREKGSREDAHAVVTQMASNCSYDEMEEIEEECQTVGEVLRIKEVLESKEDESDSVLLDSLRRLQLMEFSVETLRATEIGKAVNGLRKHNLKQIRNLVKTLIDGWRVMVDEWVEATAAIVHEEATSDSLNPSTIEDEGLPFPPLDEGALLATRTTPGKVSQYFGVIDDNNNREDRVEREDKPENRKLSFDNAYNPVRKHQLYPSGFCEDKDYTRTDYVKRQMKQQQTLKQSEPQEVVNKPNRMQESFYRQPKSIHGAELDSGPGRPKLNNNRKPLGQVKSQPVNSGFQKKPQSIVPDKTRLSDDNSVRAKLEIAKRKLQEGYQQADNAKKQRTIQVMELRDLPKQGVNQRQLQVKQGNLNRQCQGGR